MAIYHFKAQSISRGRGANAVRMAAYRHRDRMHDERLAQTYSYRGHREELTHSEIALPAQTPEWLRVLLDGRTPAGASEALWNKVQIEATRTNALLAREIVIGLPKEMTHEQQVELMRDYARTFTDRGMVVDWVIHEKQGNPHAHVMLTTHPLTEKGFGSRVTPRLDDAGDPLRKPNGKIAYEVWNDGAKALHEWRQAWARVANEHLARAGIDERIDHRSLADRGSTLEPSIHLGPLASGVQERSGQSEAAQERERIRLENCERIRANPAELIAVASNQDAAFSRARLEQVAFRYFKDEARAEVPALVDKALQTPNLASVLSDDLDRRTNTMVKTMVYATPQMVALEHRMLSEARELRLDLSHAVDTRHVDAALQAQDAALREATAGQSGMSSEQIAAVRHVTDERGIGMVVGYAGSGKSTMLKAANDAWTASGKRVYGAALAGKAAEGLETSSDIRSRTLASWEYAWAQDKHKLAKGDVFVIDEAGMVASAQLARVISAVHVAGAKAVLVGDAMQLQPIQAGAAFRALSERIGAFDLEGIRRQRAHEWQRAASLAFAKGRTAEALKAYHERDAVRFHPSTSAAHKQIIADWREANAQGTVLVLAHANKDVDALNDGIRATRKEAGELTGTEVVFQTSRGDRGFMVGDRVLFLKNDAEVKNGLLGTVVGLGLDRLVVHTDTGQLTEMRPSEYREFTHGYAATVHKSQGATVDRTLVYASAGMNRHLAYVAMTRHRDDAVMYASREVFPSLQALTNRLEQDGSASTTLDHDFLRLRADVPEVEPVIADTLTREGAVRTATSLHHVENKAQPTDAAAFAAPAFDLDGKTSDQLEQAKPTHEVAPTRAAGYSPDRTSAERQHRPLVRAEESHGRAKHDALTPEQRVVSNPTYHAARSAMLHAIGSVWKEPEGVFKAVEAKLAIGEEVESLVATMRSLPEQVGELRGREEARGLLMRFFPERAAVAAARTEREAARVDAAFAATQVTRAAVVWREVLDELSTARIEEVARAERISHEVPFLSDRAQGLLRAFEEAREAGPEAERLAAARGRDREDLTAEIKAFDEALTRRFGPEAFTDQASEPIEESLGRRNVWAASLLREIGPQVRHYSEAQRAIETRLEAAAEAPRADQPPPAPLFEAVTVFEHTPEQAARAAVLTNGVLAGELATLRAAAEVVYRDPDTAVQALVAGLGDSTEFRAMVAPLFDNPELLGELKGSTKFVAPRAEKQARAAAEQMVKPLLIQARELQATFAGALVAAVQAEYEARAAAAIPVPGLSTEASQALDQLQGASLDRVADLYRSLPATPGVRRELEAFASAVQRKFGHDLTPERISPRPTPDQRAAFGQSLARLEAARTLARGQALERAKVEERVQSLEQNTKLTR